MKKIINPWRNHPEYNCFGCCPENPIGLHMEFYEDGDYIVSTWHPQRNYPYNRACADHQGKSGQAGAESGVYQCRDNQLKRRTVQRGRGRLFPDEPGEGQGNGILALRRRGIDR